MQSGRVFFDLQESRWALLRADLLRLASIRFSKVAFALEGAALGCSAAQKQGAAEYWSAR